VLAGTRFEVRPVPVSVIDAISARRVASFVPLTLERD
jgi:hypothetical protein